MTDPAGLDNPDLIRRTFARLWKETVGDGREYPSGGEPDRMAARKLLDYHRQSKIREPWKTWVHRALRVYLSTRGDQRLEQDTWPLRYLPSKLTSIVRETGDNGRPVEATHA
jgi:hypothetical protein